MFSQEIVNEAARLYNADRKNIEALKILAESAYVTKQINYAINFYSELVRIEPKDNYYDKLSEIYKELKKYTLAFVYKSKAIEMREAKTEEEERLINTYKNIIIKQNKGIKEYGEKIDKDNQDRKYKNYLILNFEKLLKENKKQEAYKLIKEIKNKIPIQVLPVWISLAFRSGDHEEALEAAVNALLVYPTDWMLLINFIDILVQLRKANLMIDFAIAAVNIKPNNDIAWMNLGAAYETLGKSWESAKVTKKAIELNPRNASAWTNLGNALKNSGDLINAVDAYKKAIELEKNNPSLWSNYLLGINYQPNATKEEILKAHQEYGVFTESKYKENKKTKIKLNKKIKIGLVSADLRNHPVAYFMFNFLKEITKIYEINVYYNFPNEDIVSKSIIDIVSKWNNISNLNDNKVIEIIQKDDIDILIDLSGHTARSRLEVFAQKAAPIQITWLGHPNTSGLTRIDYKITDEIMDPKGVDKYYTEKLIRLSIHATYTPLVGNLKELNDEKYKIKQSPLIDNNYITFGCCNNFAKVSEEVIESWSKILSNVKNSKLLIESPGLHQEQHRNTIINKFKNYGINNEQLILINREPNTQYLTYHKIDIALDPFPYGGGTTTCDLLWMSVPLITLYGDRPMARIGAGFLFALKLDQLIAYSKEEYINKAINLALDTNKIVTLRKNIRDYFNNSIITDHNKFSIEFS